MFSDLPVEVIQQVIGHLPTASAIVSLALTNHKIHAIVSQDNYAVFRNFVQRAFPTIKTPPHWRDAAEVLTSRSRAWDRNAFIARECCPALDEPEWAVEGPIGNAIGYQPSIDSYEVWPGNSWSSRKEVLAWGAAGRLRLRTVQGGAVQWTSFWVPDDHRQELDILDVRLLQPHQHDNVGHESVVIRRANGEVVKVDSSSKANDFAQRSRYLVSSGNPTCMDVSRGSDPLLAICDAQSIQLYPVRIPDAYLRPSDSIPALDSAKAQQRKRTVKFLSDSTLAVASQFLQGRDKAPINIYDITPTGLSTSPLLETIPPGGPDLAGRHNANVIAPLDHVGQLSGRPGQLFLSGWTDGITRLHDVRLPAKFVSAYTDVVDDGQILSLLAVGHEKFVAGSHQNGCLKTFDLRMAGARAYSYRDIRPAQLPTKHPTTTTTFRDQPVYYDTHTQTFHRSPWARTRRDINIFLTPLVNHREKLWEPLARTPHRRAERYRGSIYSLSSPSPSSTSIYAGIANHVIQLDFLASDDIHRGAAGVAGLVDPTLTSHGRDHHVMNLSCYERPRHGHESTDPVLLRKQAPLRSADSGARRPSTTGGRGGKDLQQGDEALQSEDGWDERWRLNVYKRGGSGRGASWAHG